MLNISSLDLIGWIGKSGILKLLKFGQLCLLFVWFIFFAVPGEMYSVEWENVKSCMIDSGYDVGFGDSDSVQLECK